MPKRLGSLYFYWMKFILLLPLFVAAASCSAQNLDPDCLARIRKGVFVPEQAGPMEVIRTGKEYVEVYNEGDAKLFHAIRWDNDSTFTLTMKRSVNVLTCLKKGEIMKTTITTCQGNRYESKSISLYCGDTEESFVKRK